MLKWDIQNNVISKLYLNGLNIIKPWGFETADSDSFFSMEKGVGFRNEKLFEHYECGEKSFKAIVVTKMKEGKWKLELEDMIHENAIYRKSKAKTLEDTFFMDFVMRFRFKKEFIEFVRIADKDLYHTNSNVYHQYPVDRVFLKGKGFDIEIGVIDKIVPEKLAPCIYARDSGDEWVVHIRMIPKKWDKEVIKICTSWAGTRPLPQRFSDLLLSFRWIRKELWYRGERDPFKSLVVRLLFNFAAFGMVRVEKDQALLWHVKTAVL